jgi:O-antigen/teichoic acid export membrane protein
VSDPAVAAQGWSQRGRAMVQRVLASDFFRRVAQTYVTQLAQMAINMCLSLIITRSMIPEARGHYAIAMLLASTGIQFGNLGLHAANNYLAAKDRRRLPVLLGNSLIVGPLLGTISITVILGLLAIWPRLNPTRGLLLTIALLIIPFGVSKMLLQNLQIGIEAIRAYNRIELQMALLGLALTVLACALGYANPTAYLAVTLLTGIGTVTLCIASLRCALTEAVRFSWQAICDSVQYGLKSYLLCLFSFLVQRVDLLIVQDALGPRQTAYYSIAASSAELVRMLPMVTSLVFFPRITALANEREKWLLANRLCVLIGVSLLFICLVVGVFAEGLITLLFGATYQPAAAPFRLLLPGIIFWGIAAFPQLFLASEGIPRGTLALWGALTALTIALDIVFIRSFGILGAAGVSTVTYLITFVAVWFYAWNRVRWRSV